MSRNIRRLLSLPEGRSAFLWGPRKTGKTYWLRQNLPEARWIDLLQTDLYYEYASRPALLRERLESLDPGVTVVVDEVQKVPALLDEVHWLLENRGLRFILTGSSARKLRRGGANLLAGRALRREMRPLTLQELGSVDLPQVMHSGLLPSHFLSPDPADDLRSYVGDYLKEEIAAEAVVRNLPAFSEFLRVAAVCNGELLSFENVAREVGVSARVVKAYFEVLEDTLLGFRLPPWRRAVHRRLIRTDKFYFFDVGVASWLARRRPQPGTSEFGKALEHLVLLELLAYRSYREPDLEISYWRTASGLEVDFMLGDREIAVEVKSSSRVHLSDTRHLTALSEERPVGRRYLVALVREPQRLDDSQGPITVLPLAAFVERLWAGAL